MAAAHRIPRTAGQVFGVGLVTLLAVVSMVGLGSWATKAAAHSAARVSAQPLRTAHPSKTVQPTRRAVVAAAPARSPWRTGWALSLDHPGLIAGTDLSCRMVARVSLSGREVRFRLINYPSTTHITFTHLVAGIRTIGLNVDPSTERQVTVNGAPGITLAANGEAITDPIALPVVSGQDVTLSVSVSAGLSAPWHYWSSQTSGCTVPGAGDTTEAPDATSFSERSEDRWLSEVQVLPTKPLPTFVAYGDSITDGLYLPVDTDARWTDRLEAETGNRLVALNFGVAGDRITGQAPNGQLPPRVATDVMAPAGVSAVVVEMGSNDIKAGVSAVDILAEYRQLAALAAFTGETLVVATVPGRGDGLTYEQEQQLQLLNAGLRMYPIVADLDAALTDPATGYIRAEFDVGDHIHPNVAGVAVMTEVMKAALAKVPGSLGAAVSAVG